MDAGNMYTHYIKWLHGFQIWHILSLRLWRKYHTNVSSNKCTPFVQPFQRLWCFTIQESRLFRQMSKQSVVWKILLWLPSAASTDMVYSGSVLLFLTGLIWVCLSPFSCLQELFASPTPTFRDVLRVFRALILWQASVNLLLSYSGVHLRGSLLSSSRLPWFEI